MNHYDTIIVGAGPGGIFSAYELVRLCPDIKIAVFEHGGPLPERRCPIDGDRIKNCIHCKTCSIMSGFGGLLHHERVRRSRRILRRKVQHYK